MGGLGTVVGGGDVGSGNGAVAIGPIGLSPVGRGGAVMANGADPEGIGGGAAIGTIPLALDDDVLNGSLAISLVITLTLFAWSL